MAESNLTIEKGIKETLLRFNLFSHPLSIFELFKFFPFPCYYQDILSSVDNLISRKEIFIQEGFLFLPSRENIVNDRFKKLNYFNYKIKKAERFLRLIKIFPFIEGAAVANIIGDHNLRRSSDIDLLIISSPQRIWLCRFFCTSLAKILGLRPNTKTKQDKICLSFYLSSDNLNLEKYLYSEKDFYFIYWLANLNFIFSRSGLLDRFYSENSWIYKYLPQLVWPSSKNKIPVQNKKRKSIISYLELLAKKIQIFFLPKKLTEQRLTSAGVLLEDNIIKLFLEDKRPLFIKNYEESLRKFN